MSDVTAIDPGWNDESEDQSKTSWDFWLADDVPVSTLADLSMVTGRAIPDLAQDLIRLPFGKAAPPELIEEAIDYVV